MVVPFVPSRRRADDRAVSRPGGRRAAGWAVGVLLIAGALLAIATPALAATHPASPPPAAQTTQAAQTAQAAQAAQAPRGLSGWGAGFGAGAVGAGWGVPGAGDW